MSLKLNQLFILFLLFCSSLVFGHSLSSDNENHPHEDDNEIIKKYVDHYKVVGKQVSSSKESYVSVLGYHDFSKDKAPTEMCIDTGVFEKQMKAIVNSKIPVITLQDFIDWRSGNKSLPPRSLLITIDDGWKSVYTDAYPVLKKYDLPFTLFLYKNYVNVGGRSLSNEMIKEMAQNGATIGSHSVSHPFPSKVRKEKAKGTVSYKKFLVTEFKDSKDFLTNTFGQPISTYAYPGGFHTEDMYSVAKEHSYDYLFTVDPGKVTLNSPAHLLPRYIVLGTRLETFKYATSFAATEELPAQLSPIATELAHPVYPLPGSTINNRTPLISVNLSQVSNLDPTSIVVRVSGIGQVPAVFNTQDKSITWRPNRKFRRSHITINASWKIMGASKYVNPITWSFIINLQNAYKPQKLKSNS